MTGEQGGAASLATPATDFGSDKSAILADALYGNHAD